MGGYLGQAREVPPSPSTRQMRPQGRFFVSVVACLPRGAGRVHNRRLVGTSQVPRLRRRNPARPRLDAAPGSHLHPLERLSLKQEADRIEDIARTDIPAARKALEAMTDRAKRLKGGEQVSALDFNARLVTELRKRGVRIYTWPSP